MSPTPHHFSPPPSPKTVLADLVRLALLGVLILETRDPNLEELRDFYRADPILPTFFPIGLDRDNILVLLMSKLHMEIHFRFLNVNLLLLDG